MHKLLITAAVAVAAVALASFQLVPTKPLAASMLPSISPLELTLASLPLPMAESVDAH
jgi:hypothetical protein